MASDFYDFGEAMDDFASEQTKKEEPDTSYYGPWENDRWARSKGEPPVEFDWSRVCDLTIEDEDTEWQKTPLAKKWNAQGKKHRRWIATCPNPKHGLQKTIVVDAYHYKGKGKCQMCITDEINRIIDLRARRDEEYRRRFAADMGRR